MLVHNRSQPKHLYFIDLQDAIGVCQLKSDVLSCHFLIKFYSVGLPGDTRSSKLPNLLIHNQLSSEPCIHRSHTCTDLQIFKSFTTTMDPVKNQNTGYSLRRHQFQLKPWIVFLCRVKKPAALVWQWETINCIFW